MTDKAWGCVVGITVVVAFFGLLSIRMWLDDRSDQREHELKLKGKK